jgi:hypothetical protein
MSEGIKSRYCEEIWKRNAGTVRNGSRLKPGKKLRAFAPLPLWPGLWTLKPPAVMPGKNNHLGGNRK